MLIKVNNGKVSEKVQINDQLTWTEFKQYLSEKIKIPVHEIEVLIGFPPALPRITAPDQSVREIGIENGIAITVRPSTSKKAVFQKLAEFGFEESVIKEVLTQTDSTDFDSLVEQCCKSQESEIHLSRLSVPADNSCLFNSVIKLLNLPNSAFQLREIVASVIDSDPSTYNAHLLDKDPKDYINWILNSDHWGGEIEVSILSSFFEVEIVVVDIRSTINLRYGEGKGYSEMILLLYDGVHYDGIVHKRGNSETISRFSVNKEEVLEAATRLAKKLQQERQFVSLSTDTLYCFNCNRTLNGEREAVEHAKLTGHTNFGQK